MDKFTYKNFTCTIDGSWYEISNGKGVINSGNCENIAAEKLFYKLFPQYQACYGVQVYAGNDVNGNGKYAFVIFNQAGNKIDVILEKSEILIKEIYPEIQVFRHQFEIKPAEWKYLKGFKKRNEELIK
jgi:hypothetical protein